MNVDILKGLFLAILFIITMIFGLLPIKVLRILRERAETVNAFSARLSLLTCFAGGVFLGVCLLDMLPDAVDSFVEWKRETGVETEYPWVLLVAGCAFFFIYIADQAIHVIFVGDSGHGHSHDIADSINKVESGRTTVDSMADLVDDLKSETLSQSQSEVSLPSPGEDLIKSLTFIAAFLLHASLEGFALGIQKGDMSEASLFVAIIVHKAIEAFSIGTRLVQAHPGRRRLVTLLVAMVAIMAPLGGVVGIVLQDTKMDVATKSIITAVMMCISVGTFLYITFFEILGSERGTLSQRCVALLGFALIGVTVIWA